MVIKSHTPLKKVLEHYNTPILHLIKKDAYAKFVCSIFGVTPSKIRDIIVKHPNYLEGLYHATPNYGILILGQGEYEVMQSERCGAVRKCVIGVSTNTYSSVTWSKIMTHLFKMKYPTLFWAFSEKKVLTNEDLQEELYLFNYKYSDYIGVTAMDLKQFLNKPTIIESQWELFSQPFNDSPNTSFYLKIEDVVFSLTFQDLIDLRNGVDTEMIWNRICNYKDGNQVMCTTPQSQTTWWCCEEVRKMREMILNYQSK